MKFVGAVILCAAIFSFTTSGEARGDWIKGHFSPAAKIDSINRFLVLSDTRDSTFFGYGIVPTGDLNKDGIQDVILCRSKNTKPYADDSAFLFLGGVTVDTIPSQSYTTLKFTLSNIGDINKDGDNDFAFQDLPNRVVKIAHGGLGVFDTSLQIIDNYYTHFCRAVDLDADGLLDLVLGRDLSGGPVSILRVGVAIDTVPEYVLSDTATGFGWNIATGDFNGDGFQDLAVAAGLNRDTDLVKFYWGGPLFDTVPDLVLKRRALSGGSAWGERLLNVGDFNGDGIDDIYIGGNYPQADGVHFGGPTIHQTPDIVINSDGGGGYNVLNYVTPAGDVNHDGYPDILSSYYIPNAFYAIYIHLGGPQADSVPDVYIEDGDIPGFQIDFGRVTAGIGDFNGDGIDDIAVYSKTDFGCCWRSQVNFFAGWNSNPTDVNTDHDDGLPSTFSLLPAYPNPFNPSTTISFDLPKRAGVKLVVYDVLGREVRKLVDKEMAAGTHSVKWDGVDDKGKSVASGLYFFKMSAGGVEKSVKGMLVK